MHQATRTAAMHLPAAGEASPRLLQELAETVQRSRLGSPFYVLAWVFAGLAGDLPQRAPLAFVLVTFAFIVLGAARLAVRPLHAPAQPPRRPDRAGQPALLHRAAGGTGGGGPRQAAAVRAGDPRPGLVQVHQRPPRPCGRRCLPVARRLGSRLRGPGRLPEPHHEAPVEIWGQSAAEWRRARAARGSGA